MKTFRVLALVMLGVSLAPSTPVAAAPSEGRYIVALRQNVDPNARANEHAGRYGVKADRFYRHVFKGYAAKIREDRVAKLREDPSVLMVSRNHEFRAAAQTLSTGVDRIEADTVPGTGEGVQVAVMDTGIDLQHPDLAGNILGGIYCPMDGEPSTGSYDDFNGHGSHVAGTIAAIDNTTGVRGVAPNAKLWAVRVLNSAGAGDDLSLLCGLEFVFDRAPGNNGSIRVANMSIQAPFPDIDDGNCGLDIGDILHLAICTVVDAGVTFAVAAGNQNLSGPDIKDVAPAAYDEVITVTALADYDGAPCSDDPTHSDDDTFATTISNYATLSSDLAHTIGAPGVDIQSTVPGGGTAPSTGTSMASPHVAGAVARYLQTHPGASPAAVLEVLLASAEPEDVDFNSECSGGSSHTDPSGLHPEPVLRVADWEIPLEAATPGVVRGNRWYLNNGFLGSPGLVFNLGNPTDRKIVGDWNGDGTDTPGVVRGNTWYLSNDFDSDHDIPAFGYGLTSDRVVVGDWDDDGIDEPGVVRGNTWYLNYDFNPYANKVFGYGLSSDKLAPGDWNGDGKDTPGIVRGNAWYINNDFDPGADLTFHLGATTDVPLVGDWTGEGSDLPGVRRSNKWFLNLGMDGIAEIVFLYGLASDLAVVGDWDGANP